MRVRELTYMALFTALCAVSAYLSVPFAIPFTMQTFAVFLACLVLGGRRAAISLTAYLMLGAAGVPVFAGFTGGLAVLVGPTGGYLIGFPLLCLTYGAVASRMRGQKGAHAVGLIAGLIVLYAFGTAFFVYSFSKGGGMTFGLAAMKCVVPFLVPDGLKLLLALAAAKRLPGIGPKNSRAEAK